MIGLVLVCALAGCEATIDYAVTTALSTGSTAQLVFDDGLYTIHTEAYEVHSYDELRDAAPSVTVRTFAGDTFVVLPFVASECGSDAWMHSGELTSIAVRYAIYQNGSAFTAYTELLTCIDSEGETHLVDR